MAELVYHAITSLDGYVNDADGGFAWAAPDPEVFAFVNEQERGIGTYLYGRRLWELMAVWATYDGETPEEREYAAIWRAAAKIVFSRTLTAAEGAELEHDFDAAHVRRLKATSTAPVSIGGPSLAASALRAGLVDRISVIRQPVVVGGGTSWLPDGLVMPLKLDGARRFGSGATWASYTVG